MSQITRTDGLVGNSAIKYPCRMASTANLTLSGLQTIDGVVGAQDDRVLVKDQTTATQNGIYVMDSGDWERAQDADNDGAFTEGSLVKVNNGTVGQGFWYITNTGTITIDTTSIAFARASTVLAAVTAFVQTLFDDADADSFVQTLVAGLVAETAPATDDVLLIGDTSEGKGNKMTFANFLKVIDALTADATPDNAADEVVTYDASAAAAKKVVLSNLTAGPAATQAQQETGTATNVSVTPGRQHFHQSAVKAFANVDQSSGTAALSGVSYNISSVTDGATGVFTLNFTTAFSAGTYTCLCSGPSNLTPQLSTRAVGSQIINVLTATAGVASDNANNEIAILGDL